MSNFGWRQSTTPSFDCWLESPFPFGGRGNLTWNVAEVERVFKRGHLHVLRVDSIQTFYLTPSSAETTLRNGGSRARKAASPQITFRLV